MDVYDLDRRLIFTLAFFGHNAFGGIALFLLGCANTPYGVNDTEYSVLSSEFCMHARFANSMLQKILL